MVLTLNRDRPTLLSLNRFEKKKNAALAIEAFARLRKKLPADSPLKDIRLVLAGMCVTTKPYIVYSCALCPQVAMTRDWKTI